MTTLGDIKQSVKDAINKGSSLDSMIPTYIRQAARWIERNRTYQYMRRFHVLTFDLSQTYPYIMDLPNMRWKAVRDARIVLSTGVYFPLVRGHERFETEFEEGTPTKYFFDGMSRIIFNADPDEALDVHFWVDEFTSWPVDDDSTNWLIENGEDALIYQTLFHMSALLRDPRIPQLYKDLRDEALRTLLIADEDFQHSNEDAVMVYVPEGGIDE